MTALLKSDNQKIHPKWNFTVEFLYNFYKMILSLMQQKLLNSKIVKGFYKMKE